MMNIKNKAQGIFDRKFGKPVVLTKDYDLNEGTCSELRPLVEASHSRLLLRLIYRVLPERGKSDFIKIEVDRASALWNNLGNLVGEYSLDNGNAGVLGRIYLQMKDSASEEIAQNGGIENKRLLERIDIATRFFTGWFPSKDDLEVLVNYVEGISDISAGTSGRGYWLFVAREGEIGYAQFRNPDNYVSIQPVLYGKMEKPKEDTKDAKEDTKEDTNKFSLKLPETRKFLFNPGFNG